MLNRFQIAAVEAYEDGDFAWLKDSEDWRADLNDLGDGLLKFILIELSDREDCENWNEAIRRVCTASTQILEVMGAIIDAASKERQARTEAIV
jgi:hypothetical protein